jgi:diguanylate cyclase (GGDEF)-like protein
MKRFVYALVGGLMALAVALGLIIARDLDRPVLGYGAMLVAAALALCTLGYAVGRREDALVETTMTDALTGLGNRRLFELCLARETARAVDSQMPLALLALDLDDLRGHNDRGGHVAGDRAIAAVGDVLRATCRSRDLPARVGGDEFAVIMPRSTAREAAVLGERIRAALRARDPRLTVSIGAADLERAGTRDPRSVFAAADTALYEAKHAGRDRLVVLAEEYLIVHGTAPLRCQEPAVPAPEQACARAGNEAACAFDVNRITASAPDRLISEIRERISRPVLARAPRGGEASSRSARH